MKVKAISDLWIIEDSFVNDYFHALQETQKEAVKSDSDQPFMYRKYEVKCFTARPASSVKSVPARMVNALIKALNESFRIPRFIIVVPDWDILKYINYNTYGVEKVVTEMLDWMFEKMSEAIEDKRTQLRKIKEGSVVSSEPKYVWVKMLQRMRSYEKVLKVRNKFNTVLEKMLADRNNHYVIDPNPILRDASYFTRHNDLNAEGGILFWKEIDECIKLFESRKLPLRPRKDPENEPRTDSAAMMRFRMPPPPPPRRSIEDASFHLDNREQERRDRPRENFQNRQSNYSNSKLWGNCSFLSEY